MAIHEPPSSGATLLSQIWDHLKLSAKYKTISSSQPNMGPSQAFSQIWNHLKLSAKYGPISSSQLDLVQFEFEAEKFCEHGREGRQHDHLGHIEEQRVG